MLHLCFIIVLKLDVLCFRIKCETRVCILTAYPAGWRKMVSHSCRNPWFIPSNLISAQSALFLGSWWNSRSLITGIFIFLSFSLNCQLKQLFPRELWNSYIIIHSVYSTREWWEGESRETGEMSLEREKEKWFLDWQVLVFTRFLSSSPSAWNAKESSNCRKKKKKICLTVVAVREPA